MSTSLRKALLVTGILLVYVFFFFHLFPEKFRLDFSSFYYSSVHYFNGFNPYDEFYANVLGSWLKLQTNVNPPLFMFLIKPLTKLPYLYAFIVWETLICFLGMIAAYLSFKLLFSTDFLKENLLYLFLFYFALYASIVNTMIAQVGTLISFFIMAGYYCYLKNQDSLAGFFWGFITAIKFFPALIIFFLYWQKRYRLIVFMVFVFSLSWFLPLFTHAPHFYGEYFSKLPQILWYGDNWNASLYGFIFRLSKLEQQSESIFILVKSLYLCCFALALGWYLIKLRQLDNALQAFCFTLVMMLLLSPFGWLYYFLLLVLPLLFLWQKSWYFPKHLQFLSVLAFFCINFPISYLGKNKLGTVFDRFLIDSIHFYGLLLLAYLFSNPFKQQEFEWDILKNSSHPMTKPILVILVFGMVAPTVSLLWHDF